MAGAVEEGAKVATSFMDAMKSQPLALALVACNVILLCLFFFVSNNRAKEFQTIMANMQDTQKMLYRCVPTGHKEDDSNP